ncbi:MAG: hypothetical protein KIS94_14765 [Chitinophagales bacterium]|nr:hypothetical protein [Chitinophagales bacterium]
MSEETSKPAPFFKVIMDDIMLLLFLGVTIYAIFYLIWGVMEIATVPNIPEEVKQAILK